MSKHWSDRTRLHPGDSRILPRYSPTHGINKIKRLETEPKHQSLGTGTKRVITCSPRVSLVHVPCMQKPVKDVEIVFSVFTATKGSGVSADMWMPATPPPSTSRHKHSCQVGHCTCTTPEYLVECGLKIRSCFRHPH